MEDVIFAGTAGRPALGRAEVTLTIDNADGALPIAYTEVSITRRMYRSGESEYEINGDKVRLLDVQELLSDSGIGREMHVIVGQGQLDAVLSGRPEDRRAFIEEAAGVLKHRKRKEKALRKLDGMQHNLDRLADLTAELRRQLKPLGRQAEVARRAAGVQSDLRDARLRLLADDLVQLRDALDRDVADETAAREKRALVEREHSVASRRESELESELAAQCAAPAERVRHLVPAVGPDRAVPRDRPAGRRTAPAPGRRRAGRRARPRSRPARRRGRPRRRDRGGAGRGARPRARDRLAGVVTERAALETALAEAETRLGRRRPRARRPPRGPGPALRRGGGRAFAGDRRAGRDRAPRARGRRGRRPRRGRRRAPRGPPGAAHRRRGRRRRPRHRARGRRRRPRRRGPPRHRTDRGRARRRARPRLLAGPSRRPRPGPHPRRRRRGGPRGGPGRCPRPGRRPAHRRAGQRVGARGRAGRHGRRRSSSPASPRPRPPWPTSRRPTAAGPACW